MILRKYVNHKAFLGQYVRNKLMKVLSACLFISFFSLYKFSFGDARAVVSFLAEEFFCTPNTQLTCYSLLVYSSASFPCINAALEIGITIS